MHVCFAGQQYFGFTRAWTAYICVCMHVCIHVGTSVRMFLHTYVLLYVHIEGLS